MNNKKIENAASYWYACEKDGFPKWQKEAFDQWIKKDIEHKIAYEKIKKIEDIFTSLPDDYIDELEKEAISGAKKTKIIENVKYLSISAMFLLVMFSGVFKVYDYYSPSYTNTLTTQIKPIKKLLLPDGSKLAVDVKTKIDIKYTHNQRYVDLFEGQVVFNVAKNKEIPFIIKSGNIHINVVGTSFEVRNINGKTTVKVIEGKVKVSRLNNTSNKPQIITLLTKGDQITLNKWGEVLNLSKTSIKNIALWIENKINFDNTKIKDAIKEFSRYTNLNIHINNEEISNLLITGKFSTTQTNKFFEALSSIYPISIENTKNEIILKKSP